eukprot:811026_1
MDDIDNQTDNKKYKNSKQNKKGGWEKIELKIRAHKGCFSRQRHPENLLGGREIGFYSSESDSIVGDWIIFEIVNLSVIKKIKIVNYDNKKFLKNSGIKRISLWIGDEQSLKNDKWERFAKDISGIKQTMD